ncbi:nucleolar protein 9 [Plodia interpunctella]|uniref:nucleolar protein 9 n=1 Tax=Plodia interpunctella TaxID=58824 RepID=UPI0023676AF0|nr:nucleolar protein 9 [Plodia interpunctella]
MSEETIENNPNKKRVRKKRKNFLANAKKYAKKGQMGRGTRMPDELYQYFVGILDAMKQGLEDREERVALVNNVLERTKGEELNVVGNQLGCRVIEILLPYASAEDFERFIEVLSPELRRLCSDNFTSHVIETMLRVACNRATESLQNVQEEEIPKKKKKKEKSETKYSEEHIQKCHEFTLKICKYALNNLEDFVWDSYANHILRSAIKCLSGITLLPGEKPKVNIFKETVNDNKGIPPHLTDLEYKVVPEEFKELVKEFANRLSQWPQFKDLAYENLTSVLLQVLLYAIKNVDKNLTKSLLKKLLNESFAPEGWVSEGVDEKKEGKIEIGDEEVENGEVKELSLPPVFSSQPAVRLLEAALFVAKKKMYTQIYARCFINRLGQLATMPMLNFTVQRLIDNCQIKEEFEPQFDELARSLGAALASGSSGVLVAVAKACVRIKARQMQFIHTLESVLKCPAEHQKYFSVLVLRLLPSDRVELSKLDKEYFINVHGSVILQCILEFQRPAKAVNSLLELSPEELLVILCDAKGCHVTDVFCTSQCVGVKARDKMLWRLKGYYQKLALSQYGSRSFEKLYEAASSEQKVKIMTEISDKSNLLNSTPFGRLIAGKLDVDTFKLSQKKWEQTRLNKDNK